MFPFPGHSSEFFWRVGGLEFKPSMYPATWSHFIIGLSQGYVQGKSNMNSLYIWLYFYQTKCVAKAHNMKSWLQVFGSDLLSRATLPASTDIYKFFPCTHSPISLQPNTGHHKCWLQCHLHVPWWSLPPEHMGKHWSVFTLSHVSWWLISLDTSAHPCAVLQLICLFAPFTTSWWMFILLITTSNRRVKQSADTNL